MWTVTPASYAAGAAGAILVTWHEAKLPYRTQWRPPSHEFRTDAYFLVLFHMTMPYPLGLAVTYWLLDWLEANAGRSTGRGLTICRWSCRWS